MAKKQRRSLDDDDAMGFVFGEDAPAPAKATPVELEPEPSSNLPKRKTAKRANRPSTPKSKSSAMSKILEAEEREATVRLTVDMPKSMHQKLTMLSARSGKKKAEIVRLLLDEALADVDD
ncbi:MAG: hypothetical protein WBA10_01300 [Elainellaceae cyanobacterium]